MPDTQHWWCDDYPALTSYCKNHFSRNVAEAIEQADRIRQNTFLFTAKWEMERTNCPVTFRGDVQWDYIPQGDPEWVYALNRHTCFISLGQAYRLTGEERYANKFVNLLQHWIEHTPLTPESTQTTWRTLEAGLRCENWLKSYFCFQDSVSFTAQIKEKMISSLKQHGEYLFSTDDGFRTLSNWGILQNHGLFLLGVFLGEKRYIDCALKRLEQELDVQILADGVQWEQSPMYHCEVLHCCLDTLTIAQRSHIAISASMLSKVQSMVKALTCWCKPNGHLLCQSDSDDIDARDLITHGAYLFSSGEFKYQGTIEFDYENLWNLGIEAMEHYAMLEPIQPKQNSCALEASGNYMLRSSLDADANYLHFHCGCLGSGHGHADLLHIDLCVYGEDILVDSGRYTYVNSPIRKELKLPAAHNTVRVGEKDFSECIDSWGYSTLALPTKGEYRFGENYEFLSGGHLGYLTLPGGGVYVNRKILYIKPDIYIICDEFYGGGQHTYEQFFHFNNLGTVSRYENGVIYRGKQTEAKLLPLMEGLGSELKNTHLSRQYNKLEENVCLKNTLSANGFACLLTVISTSRAGEKHDLTAKQLPVRLVNANKQLPISQAQAVEINKNGEKYVAILCHQEIISEVDLLQAGSYQGYGKTLVFSTKAPKGECLQW